uniref:Uncharacterized protein n=1 Tax=Arundo donax TaxID=35708 RepID=A0A0A9ARD6_ARUDO
MEMFDYRSTAYYLRRQEFFL